jgi:hypothetical protein
MSPPFPLLKFAMRRILCIGAAVFSMVFSMSDLLVSVSASPFKLTDMNWLSADLGNAAISSFADVKYPLLKNEPADSSLFQFSSADSQVSSSDLGQTGAKQYGSKIIST